MKNILVANTKGGCGKTTLATNLAGYFASLGKHVVLEDLDRQRSSNQWLQRRPQVLPKIHAYSDYEKKQIVKPDWIITDSPAGFRDEKLSDAIKKSDCILVPIQPSVFDILATTNFLDILNQEKSIRKHKTFVGLVGMRVNQRTNATASLNEFMQDTGSPVLTNLRNSQVYATGAELGVSIFDLRPSFVVQDIEQWQPLLSWVKEISTFK